MIQPDQIHALYKERRDAAGPMWARLDDIRQAYNGDLVVALPGLSESERPAVANLIQSGIDQTARRIASVLPNVVFPPERAGDAAQKRATHKRDIVTGWHHRNKIPRKLGRRARHLIAYTKSPVLVVPDHDATPRWLLMDPLNTWPAPCPDPDEIVPPDTIWSYKRSRDYLARMWPEQYSRLAKSEHSATFLCLEYNDSYERVLIVCGDKTTDDVYGMASGSDYEIIRRIPNRTGRPLAVCPARPALDRPVGQFDGAVGLYQMQAQLMSLYMLALQRGTFGETWVYSSDPNRPARIVTTADPRAGIIGKVQGGQLVNFQPSANAMVPALINQMEASQRMDAAIPAEFGGFGATNVRTGARGAQVLSNTVDFVVQEAQLVLAESLEEENKIGFAIAKAYGTKSFSLYVPRRGKITYSPSDLDDDTHEVSYAYAGADADSLAISTLQRVGAGMISKETGMEIDPLVADVEAEKRRILTESLLAASLAGVQADFANPDGPFTPKQRARIVKLVLNEEKSLEDAVEQVDEEARAEQAAAAQGQLGPAEMQPGLTPPGAPGGLDAAAPIPELGAGPRNLQELLTSTRRPQMALDEERAPLAEPTLA